MRVAQTIVILALLASIASAVLFEDAFVKDWIKHTYGEIEHYDIVSDGEILGLTNHEQLVSLDISKNGTLNWKADLREFGDVDQFLLSKNRQFVYVMSGNDNRIPLLDTKQGILQEILVSKTIPLKLVDFFNIGVVVLGSDGLLTFIGNDGTIKPIIVDRAVKDIKVSQVDGVAYIITDDLMLIALEMSLEVLSRTKPFSKFISSIDQIKYFEDGTITTNKNKVLIIENGEVSDIRHSLNSEKKLKLLNRELAYSVNFKSINFYSIIDKKLEQLVEYSFESEINEMESKNYASSESIVLTTASGVIMLEVSGLSLGGDENVIQKFQFEQNLLDKDAQNYIMFDEKSNLQLVSTVLSNFFVEVGIYSTADESFKQTSFYLNRFEPSSSKYLMIDRPQSEVEIDKVHHLLHDSDDYHFFVSRWLAVVRRHLSQLGRSVFTRVIPSGSNGEYKLEDNFGFVKLIVFLDEIHNYVIAVDSENGSIAWECKIEKNDQKLVDIIDRPATNEVTIVLDHSLVSVDIRNGKLTNTESIKEEISKAILLKLENEEEALVLRFANNDRLRIFKKGEGNFKANLYLIENTDKSVQGYKIVDNSLVSTWRFEKPNQSLVLVKSKPIQTKTSSIGITLFDKSVLYKYLYPNLISIVSKDSKTNILRYYLLDGVSGSVLYVHEHTQNEVVDMDSIHLCMDDNWIVYTFLVKAPKLEQRVMVIDLFDTKEKSIKPPNLASSLERNSTFNFISKKSFIYPERILSIASTQTKFGITLKSILFLTESGSLIEIPKFILNSRRIANRALTNNDFQDDFRMMPYEAVIPKNNYQVLNHKNKLSLDKDTNQILMKPTELESTSVVCLANRFNIYCNLVQPSLSYDLLSRNFDRFKLVLTMLALLGAYLITKPLVFSRRLNANWIDR